MLDAKGSRLNKRIAKSTEWENKLNHKIKIKIEPNAVVSQYLPKLRELTSGSYARKGSIHQELCPRSHGKRRRSQASVFSAANTGRTGSGEAISSAYCTVWWAVLDLNQ